MEKTLSYEEYVKVKNLLTKIKGQVEFIDKSKEDIYKTIDDLNKILDIKLEDG